MRAAIFLNDRPIVDRKKKRVRYVEKNIVITMLVVLLGTKTPRNEVEKKKREREGGELHAE